MHWPMEYCGIIRPILKMIVLIGRLCLRGIVLGRIIRWIVWMGSRLGGRGVVVRWDSCCECSGCV